MDVVKRVEQEGTSRGTTKSKITIKDCGAL